MLQKKQIIEDFINPKIKELGFDVVKVVEPYCPLMLNAHPAENVGCFYTAGNALGVSANQQKHFSSDSEYKLYVMFGKDENGQMCIFCKEKQEDELYKIVEGSFVFDFNAKMFFHVLRFAEADVWNAFSSHFIVTDKQEVEAFKKMVYTSDNLFEKQQIMGTMLIENLGA